MTQNTKISDHFYYSEFFSKGIFQANNESTLKKMLDPRLVAIMEKLRTQLDSPIYINNWYWGGNSQYKCFRPQSVDVGALYSQHKFGRACDFQVNGMTPNAVRQYILDHAQEYMAAGVSRLEDGRDATTWVHIDLAWTGTNQIEVFRDISQ